MAVIDGGVDRNHEDLLNVLEGYTVGNPTGKGLPESRYINQNAHGVACAGIIGATNNSIGIRGIASNVKILPVNIFPYTPVSDDEALADAILWASERADVLSCSWYLENQSSVIIAKAIKQALSNGRNGKGCIIVFASGNNAQTENGLAFPASVEGVISVGAVDRTGNIWYYSQRGAGLSLVSPSGDGLSSSDIVTIDRMGSLGYNSQGNYYERFSGTSAACPQVAGVAALMLSVQPDLTTSEVRDILQKTATDLGPTGYDTTYGYGLLNAAAAVAEVALSINGSKISKSSGTFRIENLPKSATVNWSLDDDNKDNIKLTVSGDGNRECKAELIKPKTVKTNITATVKIGNLTLASMTKNIVLLGTFCGTYSVPATTINGVSLPAITNRPFTAGSTLEARAGQFIYITSDDLNYYSSSWSGNPIQNWTVGLNTIRFSYPATANSNTTILEFKGSVGGTVRVNVKPIGPPVSIKTAIEGNLLCVKIEEVQNDGEWEADDVSVMKCTKPVGGTWTIEVANTMTGTVQTAVTTSSGECQFTTSTWPAGIYLIKASDGTYTLSKKITIK